jgi:hypothetical protein
MTTDRSYALNYLRTPRNAPWRWEENGRVLVWTDGTTIAFREEIQLILEYMAATGLPSFLQTVCLLAACRDRYLEFPALEATADLKNTLTLRTQQLALQKLKEIGRLPRELIGSPRGKALLVQILLESQALRVAIDPSVVLRGMNLGLSDLELNTPEGRTLDVTATVHAVCEALGRHTPETLRERLRTGLDSLPTAAPELVLPRSERARRLFAALAENREHRGLALIVRDLMAAIRLPNVLSRFDEQALGGASGLINRGPLDRLLLSELAHDDLTLASRVALNEALYVNREPPAHRPQRSLAVLLDTGLRLWGVPRVLATATGLALVSRWPDESEARAWSHEGTSLKEVDLLNETAMAAHLAVLNPALDPTTALPVFSSRLADEAEVDAVIITHRETVQNPEFRSRLLQASFDRGFIALVDHDGLVQLHSLPWTAGRPLAEVQIDLEKLFHVPSEKSPRTSLVDSAAKDDFPAIFRAQPFPLLLPISTKLERTIRHGQGGVCISSDRRLFQWTDSKFGARIRATDMPGGRTVWLEVDETGRIIAVRGRDGGGKMAVIIMPVDATEPLIARFTGPQQPMHVFQDRTVLLLILHTRITVVALDSAEVLAETPLRERLRWLSGRYFTDGVDLWFVSWDGAQARWDKIERKPSRITSELLVVFERAGLGPWALMRDGRILSPVGAETMDVGFKPTSARLDERGREIVMSDGVNDGVRIMGTEDLAVRRQLKLPTGTGVEIAPPSRNLQAKFQAVYARQGQGLKLLTAKGRWLDVFFAKQMLRLVESASSGKLQEENILRFEPIQTPQRFGYGLKLAKWPNGSRAWLDSRGLLHLRSHDVSLPELTLVLGTGIPLATWASDGRLSGPVFFTGDASPSPSDEAARILEIFCSLAW